MLNDVTAEISASPALRLGPGRAGPLGVVPVEGGVNVAVFSAHATEIVFCLYDAAGEAEQSRVTLPERTGDVHHGFIPGVKPGARYGFRARGPWEPWKSLKNSRPTPMPSRFTACSTPSRTKIC